MIASMEPLYRLTARAAVALLKRGEVSPSELVDAAAERIAATEDAVNALPILCLERARGAAEALKASPPESPPPGYLHGLPVAIKDLTDVEGVRTTMGSPIFAEHVASRSDLMVERLERKGAVVIAKSNTPELGAGSHTFNEVFGITRNPWDTRLTCGGSSGGAAVALAVGQVWLAQGSDLGGSLRNPAAYSGVVGLRPSPGRVASGPGALPFDVLGVQGPMARNVADLALFLDAMAGADARAPLSLPAPATSFLEATLSGAMPRRVAFSEDLGVGPVEPEIAALCRRAAERLGELGCVIEEAAPELASAVEAFQVLRAVRFAALHASLLERHREALKPEVVWNIEKGLALTGEEIGRAERERGAIVNRVIAFFADYDLLLCPVVGSPPFPVEERYPATVGGRKVTSYIDWMSHAFAFSVTGCPALSLPCGFTEAGLPVGLQMVAPPRGEAPLLAAAHALEAILGFAEMVPMDPIRRH